MKRTRLRTTTVLTRSAAVAVASVLALSACGGGSEEPAEGNSAETAAPAEQENEETDSSQFSGEGSGASEETEAAETSDDAAAGEGTTVKIGEEFTDEETGDVITIVSAVRNNPTEYYEAKDNPNGEMVYLEVSVDPGDKFGGTISSSSFYLEADGNEANYTSTAKDELTDAGYDYFDYASRREGKRKGYVPVYLRTTADELKGSYVRPEAKVIGEDEKIPEFRGEFDVPAS